MGKTRITVDCIDQRLIVTNDPLLASGGRNEDEIEFNFCPLWDGFGKTAVFYRTPAEVYNSSVVNNRCIIPAEVLVDKGEIFFGVFGESSGATRTSEVIKYIVVQGALQSGNKPADPTPDIYNQLMARFGEVEQRVANAVQKTGDSMTGPLTVGNDLTVKGDGWRGVSFHSSDEKYRGGVMMATDNQLSFQVKESESEYADRYALPKPTTGKTADSWYQILTTKDPTGACEAIGAVNKSGGTMTGPLTVGNDLTVKGDGWRGVSFESSDGKSRGLLLISNTNSFSFSVKETGAQYSDRYTLPAPTPDRTADGWFQILTTKDIAGAVASLWEEIAKKIEATYNVTKK